MYPPTENRKAERGTTMDTSTMTDEEFAQWMDDERQAVYDEEQRMIRVREANDDAERAAATEARERAQ
jgi:hypothetical protein